ncbi:hypothetical protein SELMODRAFT_423036 [Selaginella moellendorffii]|uniref:Uncharacterized protein n=1 Tax=Selaginella moellendorffii TaxID=88036 RepID=D8SKC9_SELML|nr:hypothetical protein SELMODRAFT_423036 [Selaginella moellendorffii]
MAVWVKGNGEEARLFRLHNSKYLMLCSIAAHWGFDPDTLLVGRFALSMDKSGNSVSDVDEIRAYSAAAGAGDGLTDQTPFVITGKPAQTIWTSSSSRKPSLEETFVAAAITDEDFKKLSYTESRSVRPYRSRLVYQRFKAMRQELNIDESGVHHYIRAKDDLGSAVAPFVGALHIVPNGSRFDGSARRPVGMVSLVRCDGYCLTAAKCLEGFDGDDNTIFVSFPRMSGSGDNSCFYECKIAKVEEFVVHLEAKEQQSFKTCMATRFGPASGSVFMFSGPNSTQLVECPMVDSFVCPFEGIVLPSAKIDHKLSLGGPVVNCVGEMIGVIIAHSLLKKSSDSRGKACVTRFGTKMKVQSVSDLQEFLDDALKWKNVNNKLGSTRGDAKYEMWKNCLELRRLVQCTGADFISPAQEWYSQHPLSEFINSAVTEFNAPPLKRPKVKYVPMSEEKILKFYKEQEAVRETRSLQEDWLFLSTILIFAWTFYVLRMDSNGSEELTILDSAVRYRIRCFSFQWLRGNLGGQQFDLE